MRSAAGRVHRARPRQLPRVLAGLLVLALTSLACTGRGSPATTPATTPPEPSSTNTLRDTITTIDRAVEVEAILLELEERRLDALYREDLEALRELYANEGLYENVVPVVGTLEMSPPPWQIEVRASAIVRDNPECLAVTATLDHTDAFGPDGVESYTVILERRPDGLWGYSYLGEGWLCEGPHPFENS